MNEEIRKIVSSYISEGDFEKALSLLTNLPLDDDSDKELLESCKKEYVASCASSIAKAVSEKDRTAAERILQSYKKLMGEDTNYLLFQTLIQGIATESQKSTPVKEKDPFNFMDFYNACEPGEKFTKSKIACIVYILLAVVIVICGLTCDPSDLLCVSSVALSIALALPVLSCKNNLFKAIGLILLLLPVVSTISIYSDGPDYIRGVNTKLSFPSLPWLFSSVWVMVFCFLNAKSSLRFKVISSLLLFSILDPVWYGMPVPYGVETYSILLYRFSSEAGLMICLSTLASLCIYYFSIRHFPMDIIKNLWQKVLENKKKVTIAAGAVVSLIILVFVIDGLWESHRREVEYQQAVEQARQDSIQAAERARIAAIERARERARQDSIAAVRRREQARRDSIDYVEHAGFVSKYANIGLIISNLEITRGRDNNGDGTKGIKFTVFNPTHKTIKYVIANAHAVNQFNDRISENKRLRGMGPVGPHEFGTWDFDDAFPDRNNVIDDISVSFRVEYTNGTSKTIRWTDAYVPDFKTSWFYNR